MTVTQQESFKVIYVGAGEINFGSREGPWSHSRRLEDKFGPRLQVLGIIDPVVARSKEQIAAKVALKIAGYDRAQAWATPEDARDDLGCDGVDLIVVGAPPHFRGGTHKGKTDLDLRLLAVFPKTKVWLVEKPVSALPPSPEHGQAVVAKAYADARAKVAVGYMFRSLEAVDAIWKVIRERKLVVMSTQARFYMAYEFAQKPSWWDKDVSCGPVVEQATHLVALSLMFGGHANLSSVRTHTVEHDDAPGKLSKLGVDEEAIPAASRIPRVSNAIWTYDSGAVGSLCHVVGLHGSTYDTDFEVICDGHIFRIDGMYTPTPRLHIRQSGEADISIKLYGSDDPWRTQIDALVDEGKQPHCTYEDALETYELTWAIRNAGEAERATRR